MSRTKESISGKPPSKKQQVTDFRDAAAKVFADHPVHDRINRKKIIDEDSLPLLVQKLEMAEFFNQGSPIFLRVREELKGKKRIDPVIDTLTELPIYPPLNQVELQFIASVMLELANTPDTLK